jgi:hypothetical protein
MIRETIPAPHQPLDFLAWRERPSGAIVGRGGQHQPEDLSPAEPSDDEGTEGRVLWPRVWPGL